MAFDHILNRITSLVKDCIYYGANLGPTGHFSCFASD